MKRPLVVLGVTALLILPAALAEAHSWYPKDCCSDRDCMPVDAIAIDVRGDTEVTVGKLKVWVPKGFATRPSLDHRIHICFREEVDLKFLMPLCLFMPAVS